MENYLFLTEILSKAENLVKIMTHLKIGDQAPEFKAAIGEEKYITLSEFKGKKVLLYFYPKDMTPGCTAQACDLTAHKSELDGANVHVIGVSMDPIKRHEKFREKYDLNFPLVADEERELINLYGVWGEKKFMGKTFDGIHRISFLIDEQGIIQEIWGTNKKVKTKEHTAQVLAAIN